MALYVSFDGFLTLSSLASPNARINISGRECSREVYKGARCFDSRRVSKRKLTSSIRELGSFRGDVLELRNVSLTSRCRRRQYCRFPLAVDAALAEGVKEEVGLRRGSQWSVHKFGGTCVGTWERIQNVADVIISDKSEKKAVVVSAMSKVTDMMYDLLEKAESRNEEWVAALEAVHRKHADTARALLDADGPDLAAFLARLEEDVGNLASMLRAIFIAGNATSDFSDYVVGHGELWSAQMLAATVRKKGVPCSWMDAREVLVVQPMGTEQVDPDYEASNVLLEEWFVRTPRPADTVVVTGFIARTAQGIPTTLKRDGSDFSAAIMGALLLAGGVTIWTDVDGVYSADPRKVSEAVVLDTLSYQEAWEMSYFGANVLHPRTTIPAMKHNIPITIRNIFNLAALGTRIGQQQGTVAAPPTAAAAAAEGGDVAGVLYSSADDDDSVVKGFATIDNVALINVEGTGMAGVPGTASEIFTAVKDAGANVVMISQASSEHSVCFAVPEREAKKVGQVLEAKFKRALDAGRISKVEVIRGCSILAAVGQRMASTPGVSATLFGALAKASINVRAIAQGCSEYNITVVLNGADSVRALRAAHARFYLSKTPIAVGLVGPGNIGAELLDQFREQAKKLKEEFFIDLRILGIAASDTMLYDIRGIDLSRWREALRSEGEPADLARFSQLIRGNNYIPNVVMVDCTASARVAEFYEGWMRAGIHIITPNKKANSGPLEQYLRLRELQRRTYTHYFYEATVGAGLPIMSTLRGLLETGDRITRIEGIFSGTLSYIFNSLTGELPFSKIVAMAKDAGYTEPDPREDLSGMDVARKVVILARASGLRLELTDIPIASLVPQPLQGLASVDEFMQRLGEFDHELEAKRVEAEKNGAVLRYVGVVDTEKNEGRVELQQFPRSHPFAQLSGTDNIIAFTTARYLSQQPLIVRGPGAGKEVTAGGVFSDVLRLAAYLGAPS